jgi:hypothetical protein
MNRTKKQAKLLSMKEFALTHGRSHLVDLDFEKYKEELQNQLKKEKELQVPDDLPELEEFSTIMQISRRDIS